MVNDSLATEEGQLWWDTAGQLGTLLVSAPEETGHRVFGFIHAPQEEARADAYEHETSAQCEGRTLTRPSPLPLMHTPKGRFRGFVATQGSTASEVQWLQKAPSDPPPPPLPSDRVNGMAPAPSRISSRLSQHALLPTPGPVSAVETIAQHTGASAARCNNSVYDMESGLRGNVPKAPGGWLWHASVTDPLLSNSGGSR